VFFNLWKSVLGLSYFNGIKLERILQKCNDISHYIKITYNLIMKIITCSQSFSSNYYFRMMCQWRLYHSY